MARLVAVVGPTASGKSALALELARRYDGEIISCDSVQVYRGLDVGSSKATLEERATVPHHLIDVAEPCDEMNAARWAAAAAAAISEIAGRGRAPIIAGGTGLYLTALIKGVFDSPPVDPHLRARLMTLATRRGSERLHRLLSVIDPAYAARTRPADAVRIVRALEVAFATGRAFSDLQGDRRPSWDGECLLVGLEADRQTLRARVIERSRRMLREGLIRETRDLLSLACPAGRPPRALGAIGYRQVAERLQSGGLPEGGDDEVLRAIVTATMQYAKRQMTYFRHQFDVFWCPGPEAAARRVDAFLGKERR